MRSVWVACLLPSFLGAQAKPVDQKAIDAAVDKGAHWLLKRYRSNSISDPKYVELVLLTLVHAGVAPDHPLMRTGFNRLLRESLSETYHAGLRGLLLERVDRAFYQASLAEVAKFLVASQCENGQWNYNGKSVRTAPATYPPPPASKGSQAAPPDVAIPLPKNRSRVQTGDTSNTQYAVLGLFAAGRAGVTAPKETWEKLDSWFETKQNKDGGWGYGLGDTSTGSMTTGALTALIVAKHHLGRDWRNALSVKKGLDWLDERFSVSRNPGGDSGWLYYYLYGLERVGRISGLAEIGKHRWYEEGAEFLVKSQARDGSWKGGADEVADACFAILFLKRSTPELSRP